MRVLGIISSPRRGGNSELAAKEILNTLPDSWEKAMININDLDIKTCTACYACVPQGSLCKLKDDLGFLVEQVRQADKVVVAAPAYMLGGHTTIKRVLDRLISLVSEYRNFGPADCVIAVSYGFDGWEGMSKEDLVLFARKFHCNVIGTELMLATLPGDSVKGENLQKLRRLASLLERVCPHRLPKRWNVRSAPVQPFIFILTVRYGAVSAPAKENLSLEKTASKWITILLSTTT